MKWIQYISLALFLSLFLTSCSTYEEKDLYGKWVSKNMDFIFNEDKTMEWRRGDVTDKGRFRPFGNTLEIIGGDETVLTRVTIKSIKGDTMVIDLPAIESKVHTLTRAK